MANPDVASFFYLQKGPEFSDTFNPETEEGWDNLYTGYCVVPESVRVEAGSEPGKLVFRLFADPSQGPQGVFPAVASIVTYGKRPDGQYSEMTLPAFNGEPLKPFTCIRLREAESPDFVSESNDTRFVGVLLTCDLDLATETWLCTALEIPRWRFSNYIVRGTIWHDTNVADPKFFENTLPVFNEDGKRDMWVDAGGDRQLQFYHPDFKYEVSGYLVAKWRLGDILNYLRELYWVIIPATGKTILGIDGCSAYMDWAEVTTATHGWLFKVGGFERVFPDFALGGMTLLEAIDTIIRKAGSGAEWGINLLATRRWEMVFYDRNGTGDLTLARGSMGEQVGMTPPAIASGMVGYDWTGAADSVKVFGRENKHEVAIAYDPNDVMEGVFPDIVKPDWSDDAQTNYTSAEIATDAAADTDFPNVFTKFCFREDENWSAAFGGTFPNTKQGQRDILGHMLTKALTGSGQIQGKIWRWLRTDDGVPLFISQPETVSLTVNSDFSFSVHGHYVRDEVIPGTENDEQQKFPRFLCSIPTDASPWSVRPFVITLAVPGDERAVGVDNQDVPEDWPPGLEDTPDTSKLENHWRYKVIHFLDATGKPVEDNPISVGLVSIPLSEKILDNQDELNTTATVRRRHVERPICEGGLTLGGNLDWTITPGKRVETITGGGAPIALPTLKLGVLVKAVTFTGLGLHEGSAREQRVEIGNV